MNQVGRRKPSARMVLSVISLLLVLCVSAALVLLFLFPKEADALRELQSIPLYPNGLAPSYEVNLRYVEPEGKVLMGGSVPTKSLTVTRAALTFESVDGVDAVMGFYNMRITESGYWAVEGTPPEYRYLRWDDPYEIPAKLMEMMRMGNADRPLIYHEVRVAPVGKSWADSGAGSLTRFTLQVSILSEDE